MRRNTKAAGYFLYHSIGIYPGKDEDMARAMAEFSAVWAAPDDRQWGYVLRKRQEYLDAWGRLIRAPKGSITHVDNVTEGMHKLMRALPEGWLRGKKVLVGADCFPSLHFLLAGLAPKIGFTLVTVPRSEGKAWVETEDFIAQWDRDVALSLLTWVTSTASARMDYPALVAHGRAMGSLMVADITQAAGLLPFDVTEPRVDFVVSTSLKWLCGTPGAGILYVDKGLVADLQPEARGWFSQNNPFSWDLDKFQYAPDVRRFDSGTPGSVAAIASLPAIQWFTAQDQGVIAARNRSMVDQIIDHADALGLPLLSPREAERRGGAAMLRMPSRAEAAAVVGALGVEGYSVDFRDTILRLSPGIVTEDSAIETVFDITKRTMDRRQARFAGQGINLERKGKTMDNLLGGLGEALLTGAVRIVDCTAVLGPDTPLLRLPEEIARNTPQVKIHKISNYDIDGPYWAWNWLELGEHSGTHFDAPHHWLTGKDYPDGATDTLDVQRLMAPVNVIDCSAEAAADPDFLLTAQRVKEWEARHGEIGPGEWVVMRTDWDKRMQDAELFLNMEQGPDGDGAHTPGPSTDCMDYLLSKGIVGWGTQCVGTDAGMAGTFSPPYPAHNFLHRDNCFGLASLCNLDQLPPKGAILMVAPLKIEHGTGSPIRALALVQGG
ncbi:aminotransferase class V-fold PLP-dependent enzyme [Pararhodobacter aggregans]|uniref:aminotransferase class V-fold PLP-dependent enzyme n=1 Tax=Pararhodobacter aggregans TaxID=404875 RepID=UPI003A8F2DA7